MIRRLVAGLQEGFGQLAAAMRSQPGRSASWLMADKIVRLGGGAVLTIWISRYLGPSAFGVFSFSMALALLFGGFGSLGLDTIAVRELVKSPADAAEILGTSLALRLLVGSAMIGAALAAAYALRPDDPLAQRMTAIIAAASALAAFDVIDDWFQSRVLTRPAAIARTAAFAVAAALRVVLILRRAPLEAFAWAWLAESALAAAALSLAYRFARGRFSLWRARARRAASLLRDSAPLLLSSVAILVYMRIDQIMLGKMAGDAELGIYSAAVRLAELWYFVPAAIVASALPGIVQARAAGEAQFLQRLQRLYSTVAFVAYAFAIPLTLVATPLVRLLFGREYQRAGPMLAVLVWGGLFVSLGVARSAFLTAMNWTRTHLLTVATGGALNVVLNLWLIPRWGGMGAVIASCIAYWWAAHGSCFVYPPLRQTGWMLTSAILLPRPWRLDQSPRQLPVR
jgi:O-antigen/teichoic acid export membrane protein